jgi:hypothetical protein
LTRGRAYRKNNSAPVAQKNGAIVRRGIGYDRFTTKASYAALHAVYRLLRLHVNFFQPVQKLVTRVRVARASGAGTIAPRPVSTPLRHRRPCSRRPSLRPDSALLAAGPPRHKRDRLSGNGGSSGRDREWRPEHMPPVSPELGAATPRPAGREVSIRDPGRCVARSPSRLTRASEGRLPGLSRVPPRLADSTPCNSTV